MTDPDDFAALRAALKAGPTPGPWKHGFPRINGEELRTVDCQVSVGGGFLLANVTHGPIFPVEPHASKLREANAAYIAAANPEVIARLLAELDAAKPALDWLPKSTDTIDAQRAEIDRLQAELDTARADIALLEQGHSSALRALRNQSPSMKAKP